MTRERQVVVIDPGHGGADSGAIGRKPWTVREQDVAWAVAVAVAQWLEPGAGHAGVDWLRRARRTEVRMTRPQGRGRAIADRASFANEARAAAFVSIHANAYSEPAASGVEVLHYGSAGGERLAREVIEELARVASLFGVRNRGLKVRRGLGVLRLTRMPAVIVELPFLTNPVDMVVASNWRFQAAAGVAIGRAIDKWLEEEN